MTTLYYNAPLGCFKITGSPKGIRSVQLCEKAGTSSEQPDPILLKCAQQLDEYFQRKRQDFNLTLDWDDTSEFYQSVWQELLKIPYGRTTHYGAIAKKIGQPQAAQAIGLANRSNPIAIIVPCHRVNAKTGKLHGYFYGLDFKRRLLELENPLSYGAQGSLF